MKFLFVLLCMAIGGAVAWLGLVPEGADILAPLRTPEDPAAWSPAIRLAGGVIGGLLTSITLISFFSSKLQSDVDQLRASQEETQDLLLKILQQTAPEGSTAMDVSRASARKEAAQRLVSSEPEAASAIAKGKLKDGLGRLKTRAQKASESKSAEAAQEWRDIGALAFDRDPQAALLAYREAVRLDGADFWSWIFLARLENWEADDLDAAWQAAKKAAEISDTPREKAQAYEEQADLALKKGDLKLAQEAADTSLRIRRTIAENPKATANDKRGLSISLIKRGDVEARAGNYEAARVSYNESINIARQISGPRKNSAEAKRDISVLLNKLGDVEVQTGNLVAAGEAFRESLDIRKTLAAANPKSAEAQRDLWVTLWKMADLKIGDVTWQDVFDVLQASKKAGILSPSDEKFLEQAKAKAAAESG